ncbi:MAG: M20 family peptidase [Lautropia sp.]
MSLLRKTLAGVGLLLLALLAVALARAIASPDRQLAPRPVAALDIDADEAARGLAGAVRLRTVSMDGDPHANEAEFFALHDYLRARFPKTFAAVRTEQVGGRSLLLTWQGSDPSLPPAMFMAHQDVVPIAPGTEAQWTYPPFDGVVADGFVWGRGAWDDKSQLVGLLEALERLVGAGVKPARTILLAFGHDEETSGTAGAREIAALLAARGVKLEFVLDEGLVIAVGLLPGLARPAALVGIGEKGYATLEFTVTGEPGHASMPPRETPLGRLARALATLEASPSPARLSGAARQMFDAVVPGMTFAHRLVLGNLWLTAPLVRRQLEASPSTAALLRTTTALTVVNAGNKDNVIPGEARALVNFRILPGDSIAGVIDAARATVADPGVKIAVYKEAFEPTPSSSTDGEPYRRIAQAVRDIYPDTLVAPGLMIAATDSRHMAGLTDQIFRFSPIHAMPEDLKRFHGTNERIGVDDYVTLIRFYHHLIGMAAAGGR